MPRRTSTPATKYEQARAYAREHKLGYDVAYHFMLAAITADGKAPRLNAAQPEESTLTTEEAARLATAKRAIGL